MHKRQEEEQAEEGQQESRADIHAAFDHESYFLGRAIQCSSLKPTCLEVLKIYS
jgi:hypothetical protein